MFVILLLATQLVAQADEQSERDSVKQHVAELFRAEDFVGLERIAAEYRTDKTRTSSGSRLLESFYLGIRNSLEFDKGHDAKWDAAASTFDRWVQSYPRSATPYVAKAAALMGRGWTYRGEGWAGQVAPQDMQAYRDFATRAATILIDNKDTGESDPHYFAILADTYLALGASKEDYLGLLDRGAGLFPDYDPLYFRATMYLSEKWYGSDAELEQYIRSVVKKTKRDRGYELYARMYWAAGMRNRREYAFQSPNANFRIMIAGMDEILQRYPTQWNINHFAYFTCYNWDENAARKYFAMLREPIIEEAWDPPSNYGRCRNRLNMLDELQQQAAEFNKSAE